MTKMWKSGRSVAVITVVGATVLCAGIATARVGRELGLGDIRLDQPSAFAMILSRYGSPTMVVAGNGTQSGGFNVGGFGGGAAAGGGGGGMAGRMPGMGGGPPGGAYPGMGGAGGGPPQLPPAGGGGGGPGAGGGGSDQGGLVTWVYEAPHGVRGDTLMVTFDEENNHAVATVRILGTRLYPWARTRGGIAIGSPFSSVLERYGYPDLTVPLDYSHTAVYYFNSNVAFGFAGNGPNMVVDSITVGIGEQPQEMPGQTAGTGMRSPMGMGGPPMGMGGARGGYPGMGGGPPGGAPGMRGGPSGGKFGGMGGGMGGGGRAGITGD